MTVNEIRDKFIQYLEERGHKAIPSYPLVPENDPSVLFTTAGMHPLVPYLMGEKHPLGKRLVDSQICLRTKDIDEVGDSSHLTFFEMLGYWSLGDYFKKESIRFTFDFYTEVLGFDKDKISPIFLDDLIPEFQISHASIALDFKLLLKISSQLTIDKSKSFDNSLLIIDSLI
jgi:alanyl-tRNA synthetase